MDTNQLHSDTASQSLIVRQPIFNDGLKVVSYQLRYEDSKEPGNALLMDNHSAASLLLTSYTSLSQDGNSCRVPLFLPFSADLLAEIKLPALPIKRLLIEVPSGTIVSRELLLCIISLKQQGYRIVLDGFALQRKLFPLLRHMKIIKIDMVKIGLKQLPSLINALRKLNVTLMAQNVEDFKTLEVCKRLGFKLFQGNFICRPVEADKHQLSTKSTALLQLLKALQDPDTTADQIEDLVLLDPILSFKILRVINSAAYTFENEIQSMRQAIVLLGLNQIRIWAMIIMCSNQQGKPEEWSRGLITRARMCELLAELSGMAKPESAFMVGMLSQLDLLLEVRIELILKQIPVEKEIKLAVLKQSGPLGTILQLIIDFERGNWDQIKCSKIPASIFETAYRHSINWTNSAMQAIHDNE